MALASQAPGATRLHAKSVTRNLSPRFDRTRRLQRSLVWRAGSTRTVSTYCFKYLSASWGFHVYELCPCMHKAEHTHRHRDPVSPPRNGALCALPAVTSRQTPLLQGRLGSPSDLLIILEATDNY